MANVHANELRLDEIEYMGVADQELDKLLVRRGDLLVVEDIVNVGQRPKCDNYGDYVFIVDMQGKVDDPTIADALRCLCCKLPRLTVLGSYPVGSPLARSAGA